MESYSHLFLYHVRCTHLEIPKNLKVDCVYLCFHSNIYTHHWHASKSSLTLKMSWDFVGARQVTHTGKRHKMNRFLDVSYRHHLSVAQSSPWRCRARWSPDELQGWRGLVNCYPFHTYELNTLLLTVWPQLFLLQALLLTKKKRPHTKRTSAKGHLHNSPFKLTFRGEVMEGLEHGSQSHVTVLSFTPRGIHLKTPPSLFPYC